MIAEIKNDILKVRISSLGAELQSICKNGKEFLWQGDKAVWEKRSPLLFPIVGRLKNDELKYNGNTYILKKHGFAQEKEFTLLENTSHKAVFMLEDDNDTKKAYPFNFKLLVSYEICENNLEITYEVLNTDKNDIFFSIGGHPGFNCAIGDTLEFEKKETIDRLVMNENSYISEKRQFLNNEKVIKITKELFEDDALIIENLKSRYILIKKEDGEVRVNFGDAPYLGIWAKPNARYVCIEPWFGVDDSIDAEYTFDKKKGIISLDTESKFKYSFDISFK